MGDKQAIRLKEARKELGLSQDDAFARLRMAGRDISLSSYKRWERGERDLPKEVAEEVIRLLGKSEEELMKKRVGPPGLEMQPVPEIETGGSEKGGTGADGSTLALPRPYVRSEYGVDPERLVLMRVRGLGMADTLRPGQTVLAARHEGEDLEDDVIYGLRGPLGFTVKRLRFDRKEGTPVIWIWPDNPELEDQRRCLELSELEEEYDVVAKALEVRQKL